MRKPETGAKPMQFYLMPEQSALDPLSAPRPSQGVWIEMPPHGSKPHAGTW